MGRLEIFKRGEFGKGDPLSWHPMNQKLAKNLQERRGKGEESSKVERAARKRLKQQQFLQDLPKMQFNRALGHIVDGTASEKDIDYVAKNANRYERQIESFSITRANGNVEEKVTKVTITIVDFTRNPQSPCNSLAETL